MCSPPRLPKPLGGRRGARIEIRPLVPERTSARVALQVRTETNAARRIGAPQSTVPVHGPLQRAPFLGASSTALAIPYFGMRSRRGELSASTAVLALLIDRPDSVLGLSKRLVEQFPQAHFQRNAVHKALPSLQRQGLISVVDDQRSFERYEATPEGRERCREALRAASAAIPAVRDALRARLEQVDTERELRDVIDLIREHEQACLAQYAEARKRLRKLRQARVRGVVEEGIRDTIDLALLIDEAVLWGSRAKRLQRMRESLGDDPDQERGEA